MAGQAWSTLEGAVSIILQAAGPQASITTTATFTRTLKCMERKYFNVENLIFQFTPPKSPLDLVARRAPEQQPSGAQEVHASLSFVHTHPMPMRRDAAEVTVRLDLDSECGIRAMCAIRSNELTIWSVTTHYTDTFIA